jgi:5-methyltetrahydrofolate--homocysteine methyltransferase
MNSSYQKLTEAIISGRSDAVTAQVQLALDQHLDPGEILHTGMIPAMEIVGDLYEKGEYYVPEMLVAARAMQTGLEILRPHLKTSGVETAGVVIIGTVQGDLHDIGKNLVGMMLEGAGYEIIDLGTDVSPDAFVETAKQHPSCLMALSALLTTTMTHMETTITAVREAGIRDQVKIIVGGAPVTQPFSQEIGADGYASDASQAVKVVKELFS